MANAAQTELGNGCEVAGGGGAAAAGGGGGGGVRGPRLPRWTRQEILVLIQGKKVAEGRRRGRGAAAAGGGVVAAAAVEPKWAAVAAYCQRHGVERGAVQCRKRWSNLAGDYKKIKAWERGGRGEKESFWAMRNDLRRERRLPGFFDREVYDILDGVVGVERRMEEEEVVFDSGRGAGEDGLFSEGEDEKEDEEEEEEKEETAAAVAAAVAAAAAEPVVVMPISEKKYEPLQQENFEPALEEGMTDDKQQAENPEKASSSREGQKRRRTSSPDETGDTTLQHQLIEVLERNSRMLTAQLEAQNTNCRLDRDQRQGHADNLLGILGKLADALGRIADKL